MEWYDEYRAQAKVELNPQLQQEEQLYHQQQREEGDEQLHYHQVEEGERHEEGQGQQGEDPAVVEQVPSPTAEEKKPAINSRQESIDRESGISSLSQHHQDHQYHDEEEPKTQQRSTSDSILEMKTKQKGISSNRPGSAEILLE